ncbi:MAG: PAQR family membrane homeostasis protein TrhA [Desulfitobacteriaceae bacterium]
MKEPVNTWTHLVPFLAAIVAWIVIIVKTWESPAKLVSMTIYAVSVILLFGISSFYHGVRVSPQKELLLRKFDHMAIYLLIAGSYTPVLLYGLHGVWRWVMLPAVWILALGGILLKIWFINAPRKLSTALYVLLGWMALVPFFQLVRSLPAGAIILMFLGGVSYTIGAAIYATKKMNFFPKRFGFHEIFHIFVALGGVLHFIMMIQYILPM